MSSTTTHQLATVKSAVEKNSHVMQAITENEINKLRDALRDAINPEAIPDDLKYLKGFVCWKVTELDAEKGRFNKIPFYPGSGKMRQGKQGVDEDLANLGTWDEAMNAFDQGGDKGDGMGAYVGIGFAMHPDWGLIAFDADHCIHGGLIQGNIAQLVKTTYAEISPSGTGIRAFWRGKATNAKNSAQGIELYSTSQFVTLTGNRVENNYPAQGEKLPELDDELRKTLEELLASPAKGSKSAGCMPNSQIDLTKVTEKTLADLREALSFFTETDASDYAFWIMIGHALKSLAQTKYVGFVA